MAGAVNCRQSAARGLATLGVRQWKPANSTPIRNGGNDSSIHYSTYYAIRKKNAPSCCREQRFVGCHDRLLRRISTTSWSTSVCVWHENSRQVGVETCLATGRSPGLRAHRFPSSQSPPSGSWDSAGAQEALASDVCLRSLLRTQNQEIGVQVIVRGQGREWLCLMERTSMATGLSLAPRLESGPHEQEWLGTEQASALLPSRFLGSITTVDGRNADDIVVEHQARLASKMVTGEHKGLGVPAADVGSLEKALSSWDMSEGHLDSFRTLFASDICCMPYHAGLGCLAVTPCRLQELAFSGTAEMGSTSPQKGDPRMEEHLAVLYEKLQLELPNFFLKPHDYEMYSQNVEFISTLPWIRIRGRNFYRVLVTLSRCAAWSYYTDLQLEVMKMTQHPEDWTVQVRWRVTGIPLHLQILKLYKKDKAELYRTYDAYSIFYLGPDGLVHRHKVSKMMPSQPPLVKVKRLLVGALVALGLEEHRPALNLSAQLADKVVGQKHC
ncbi:uncharacterized protein C6orf136 homolog [Narcine bancroftii]|uniref:uncharacterized protein C6orf136 homolog n=1 Tax=Narcine bancroftii TaxID=1343680 RepID=UPI003831F4A7